MHNTQIKEEAIRIKEASSIRSQLQNLGVLVVDEARFKLRIASNEYIRTGYSTTFRLKVDDRVNAIIHFRSNPQQQSGVILEYV